MRQPTGKVDPKKDDAGDPTANKPAVATHEPVHGGGARRFSRSNWRYLGELLNGQHASLKRLDVEIAKARQTLGKRKEANTGEIRYSRRLDNACASLTAAQAACEKHETQRGWTLVHLTNETEVLLQDGLEMITSALSLRAEVAGKPWWQAQAIAELLHGFGSASPNGAHPPPQGDDIQLDWDRTRLQAATRLRNDYYIQKYDTIEVTARRRIWLLLLGIVGLLAALYLLCENVNEQTPVQEAWVPWAMVVAGALGAITSALQRLATDPNAAIPAELGSFTTTVSRPFIGAVAALTVYLAFLAKVGPSSDETALPLAVLAAFGAGFTERLIVYSPK